MQVLEQGRNHKGRLLHYFPQQPQQALQQNQHSHTEHRQQGRQQQQEQSDHHPQQDQQGKEGARGQQDSQEEEMQWCGWHTDHGSLTGRVGLLLVCLGCFVCGTCACTLSFLPETALKGGALFTCQSITPIHHANSQALFAHHHLHQAWSLPCTCAAVKRCPTQMHKVGCTYGTDEGRW